jgi:paraquat-inducible protein B
MSAPTNHWKLGAFVVAAVLVGLTAVAVLTAQALQVVTVTYASYFDEAVTGLDVGSPVSFRGVNIGNVSAIEIAPDRRHVEIIYSLGVTELERLGLGGKTRGKDTKFSVPPGLRIQIASTGLAGTKYLQIDFFDTQIAPPPVLPFPVPANYIPAIPSTMKNLEDAVVRAVDAVPALTSELASVVSSLNVILADVNGRGLPEKAVATLDRTDRLITSLQGKLDELPVAELSREAAATFAGAKVTLANMDRVLARLDGDDGLLASVQRASDGLGDVAGPALGTNLDETGRDLREAAVAVRQLADALQRDPDMLIKGKARAQR